MGGSGCCKEKMPDTIVLSVIEHVPAAYWNDNGIYDARTKSIFIRICHNLANH